MVEKFWKSSENNEKFLGKGEEIARKTMKIWMRNRENSGKVEDKMGIFHLGMVLF
jgi:hypothetical protein